PLRSLYDWTTLPTPCALHTICGFCPLATAVAAGRGAGHIPYLLEAAACWSVDAAVAYGPSAPGRANLPRCQALFDLVLDADAGAQDTESAARGHLVHDVAGGLPDPAVPLCRSGRHRGGLAHCQS